MYARGSRCFKRMTNVNPRNDVLCGVQTMHGLDVIVEILVMIGLLPHPETYAVDHIKNFFWGCDIEMMLVNNKVQFKMRRRCGRRMIDPSKLVYSFSAQCRLHIAQVVDAYRLLKIVIEVVDDNAVDLSALF